MNPGSPERLQLRKVFHGASIISKKIHAVDTVAVIEPVIYFRDKVLNTHVIVKSIRDADTLTVICGKTLAIARYRCAGKRAACNL